MSKVKTKEAKYLVSGIRRTHIWLEVLDGPDVGMRVSIPLYSDKQDEKVTDILHSLKEKNIVSVVLESQDKLPRNWTVNSIKKLK